MTIFIIWPHGIDADFRAAYLEATEEAIQVNPRANRTHYAVGSSRLTHEQLGGLILAFPDVRFVKEAPAWYNEPEPEEVAPTLWDKVKGLFGV